MKKYFFIIIGLIAAAVFTGFFVVQMSAPANNNVFSRQAADDGLMPFSEISRAEVLEIKSEDLVENPHFSRILAVVQARILSGGEKGREVEVEYQDQLSRPELQKLRVGDQVVIGKISTPEETVYTVIDRYRIMPLVWMFILFIVCALLFGRTRGAMSLVGLAFSIIVLILFIAPNLLAGKNPLLVTMVGAGAIVLVSIFLAHGFRQRTVVAVIGTITTLLIAEGLAYGFVVAAHLLGKGTEDAFYLQQGFMGALDMRGLLLSGVIIGTLGVLDDITTAQSAVVEELLDANPNLGFKELFYKASSVGREHISSLINTLVLAYAGASLPLFLLLSMNSGQPLWVIINSEFMAEEILRALIGSMALIIAVPLTTSLAAWYFTRERNISDKLPDDYWDKAKDQVGKLT